MHPLSPSAENVPTSDSEDDSLKVTITGDRSVLFAWGRGHEGCLGFGHHLDLNAPKAHPLFLQSIGFDISKSRYKEFEQLRIVRLRTGPSHAIVQASDDSLWVWGAGMIKHCG